EDHERSDLRRRPDVRASAELAREAGNLDDAHMIAVLLAEQHHRAEPARLVDRRHEGAYRQILEHLLVHEMFDSFPLFVRELSGVREVETKLVRSHGRARLLDMLAEHVAE